MISRLLICSMLFALVGAFSGCCGISGRVTQCNGCNDGYGGGGGAGQCAARPAGPLVSLLNARRQLICGSGCGEAYYGEWISTPPDCNDPCAGEQFVGGATPSNPFCVQPGTIFGNLYGSRNCEFCGNAFSDCGCGDDGYGGCPGDCGGGCCGGAVQETYVDAGTVIDGGHGYGGTIINSGPSCSTCNSGNAAGNTRIARQVSKRTGRTHQTMTQQYYHQQRAVQRR